MPAHAYSHAIIRVVPRVERQEQINVGAIAFCRTLKFLEACVELDERRLCALAPEVPITVVKSHLDAFCRICRGEAGAGPIAQLGQQERFYWLVAPRSTMIQTSPLHAGVTESMAGVLERLMDTMVRPPR